MKEFNPQIGDTIVTKERGNFICANYEEYIESKDLSYRPEYASAHIFGVRKYGDGFMTWNENGRCLEEKYCIVEIIPQKKTFHPNPGDTIVTKEKGNFICGNYKEYVESKGIGYAFEYYASRPICGVRDSGFNTWDEYGKCRNEAFNIVEIIPAQKPEIKITVEISQESKIKTLELENAMLRMLLRKEGVDV